jgi:cobalt-zinc-cadmium efflux system membrane fusion protein
MIKWTNLLVLLFSGLLLCMPLTLSAEDHDEHEEHTEHNDHDDDNDDDDHEEGQITLTAEQAAKAGIKVSVAGSQQVHKTISLTGKIILNRDTTADIVARFPGAVKTVNVRWGEQVTEGSVLATVESNDSLRSYKILSPMNGIVLERNTNVGNVAGGQPLFTLADLSTVWAEFHIFPKDINEVEEGQTVRLSTLENSYALEAPIELLLPTADTLSQTVIAIVSVANANNQWRPGMSVQGELLLSSRKVPVAIAEIAIQRMEDEIVVFVREGDNYKPRPITLGVNDGYFVEVLSGLSAGESYVSEGSFIVKADILKSTATHQH